MFTRSLLIFTVLLTSSVTVAMDKREMQVANTTPSAFYPNQQQLTNAAQLGFPTDGNIPFVSLRFLNRKDYISLDPSGKDTRRLIHLPVAAVIGRNGLISLPKGIVLSMEKEEEFSILSAIANWHAFQAEEMNIEQ